METNLPTPNADMNPNKPDVFYETYYLCSCGDILRGENYGNRQNIPSVIEKENEHKAELIEIVEIIGTVVWRKSDGTSPNGT